MKKRACQYKVMVMLLCLVCLCLPLSACSGNGGEPAKNSKTGTPRQTRQTKYVKFDVIEKEYLDTLKELNWPEGYSLPTKMEVSEEGKAGEFQAGWGVTSASQLWECTWMKEWLKSYRTDAKRAEAAIKELEKAPGMPYMDPSACDETTRRFFKEYLDKAKLGDPSGFETNIRLNSPE